MSTKIYNGYSLPLMTLKELTEFIKSFRKQAEKKAGELIAVYMAHEISELIDDLLFLDEEIFVRRHLLYKKEKEKLREQEKLIEKGIDIPEEDRVSLRFESYPHRYAHGMVYRKAQERYDEIQRTQHRDPVVDFDCNACFIPLEDKVVALFYSEQDELEKLWKAHPDVSYYGYWNNTDPDEEASDEEWEQRKRDWDEALPGLGIPMENGICADFVKGFVNRQYISPSLTLASIPSVYERAKRIADERVMDRKFNEIKASKPEKDEKPWDLDAYHETRRWMRSPEGKQAVKEELDKIIPLLTCKIKKAHLFTNIHLLAKGELDQYEDEKVVKKPRRSSVSIRGKARKQGRGLARKSKVKPKRRGTTKR